MSTLDPIIGEAETLLRQLAEELTRPHPGECLCCYVIRQVDDHGCDNTHRHAVRYRDLRAPRAKTLIRQLRDIGACCCDCEIFINAYGIHRRFWTPEREVEAEFGTVVIEAEQPHQPPPCAGVVEGSVQPCTNWVWQRSPS